MYLNKLVIDKFCNVYELVKPSNKQNYFFVLPLHSAQQESILEIHLSNLFDLNLITKH